MTRKAIRLILHNYSHFSKQIVWDNAQDLEHVAAFHHKTNQDFELLAFTPSKHSEMAYETLVFRATRKFLLFRFQSFGYRKILAPFHMHQMDVLPFFRLKIVLNSMILNSDNPDKPTELRDEVVIEGPFWVKWCRPLFQSLLQRHTQIQCLQDEGFRERRELLLKKGMKFPLRFFNEPALNRLEKLFQGGIEETLPSGVGEPA